MGVYLKYVFMGVGAGAIAYNWRPHTTLGTMAHYLLWYSCFGNCLVAALFKLKRGASLICKDPRTGHIPWWSYVLFCWFHVPTIAYTYLQHRMQSPETYATEILPHLYIGGRYANYIPSRSPDTPWAAIVDLTCEFPPAGKTKNYYLCRTWDGTAPSPEKLDEAARFVVDIRNKAAEKGGDVLVHCAHGKGRSTMVMCAVLVKAGLAPNWEAAFEICKSKRDRVKLNIDMRSALTEWSKLL